MDRKIGLALLRNEFQNNTGLMIEQWHDGESDGHADARLQASGVCFAVLFKAAANTEQIGSAIGRLSPLSDLHSVPLLVVPYMGEAGRAMCRANGIAWIDLSGNAEIETPSLRIRILGMPNRYKRSGRPESLFAPRSARAARTLLLEVDHIWKQTELAEATGLSAGYLSRLLPRYQEAGFIESEQGGRSLRYRVTNPDAMLDAWYADYDFNDHTILRGHVAARSGPELLRELSAVLASREVEHAATGLAGAWLWEPFAAFRTVAIYLKSLPSPEMHAAIGFHEGARGSNTWLVVPNDDGVFTGSEEREGVRCVSAVQVYLDLKGQPERAEEARAELRRTQLNWPNSTPQKAA